MFISSHPVVMAKRVLKQSNVIQGDVFIYGCLLKTFDGVIQGLLFSQFFIFLCCHSKVGGSHPTKHLLKCCLQEQIQ